MAEFHTNSRIESFHHNDHGVILRPKRQTEWQRERDDANPSLSHTQRQSEREMRTWMDRNTPGPHDLVQFNPINKWAWTMGRRFQMG